jgi:hypothetical protein
MYSNEWHECIVLEDQIDAKHARNMQRKEKQHEKRREKIKFKEDI